MNNSRPRARQRHAPDDDIEFYFLQAVTNFFQSVWMQLHCSMVQICPAQKGWMLSKSNKLHATTTETTWACVHAQVRTSGGVHSCSSTTISEGGCGDIRAFGCYDKTHSGFPRLALLAVPKREWLTSELHPVELPRLARPKGCFAAY